MQNGNIIENMKEDNRIITEEIIEKYEIYLTEEEKSSATIEKYIRNVRKSGSRPMGKLLI